MLHKGQPRVELMHNNQAIKYIMYWFLVSLGVLSAPITHSSGKLPSLTAVRCKFMMMVLSCISAPWGQSSNIVVMWWLVFRVPCHCEPFIDTCNLEPCFMRVVLISDQSVGTIPAVWSILSIFMNHFLPSEASHNSYYRLISYVPQQVATHWHLLLHRGCRTFSTT